METGAKTGSVSVREDRVILDAAPVIPPEITHQMMLESLRAYSGNMYDAKGDNRKKNQLLILSNVVMALITIAFTLYVSEHRYIRTVFIDTSHANNVPFRVLAYDNTETPPESLLYYFMILINDNLHSHTPETLVLNRKVVIPYLNPQLQEIIDKEVKGMVTAYAEDGEFPRGNQKAKGQSCVIIGEDEKHETQKIQVYSDVDVWDAQGERPTHQQWVVTYTVSRVEISDQQMLRVNPLGLCILDWTIDVLSKSDSKNSRNQ